MSDPTDDRVELAPWLQPSLAALLRQRGHAWLLHGPSGLGQYELGLALAAAWLCERPGDPAGGTGREGSEAGAGSAQSAGSPIAGACGHCPSCHAIRVRTHADLCMLMPEVAMAELGWPLDEKSQSDIDDKKRKPSREIRVEAMREAVGFAQRTSARGRGKVVMVYPAERMNTVTANALLKTLEEPVGDVRFVLATESAGQLLPTIRSRCLGHALPWPDAADACAWLVAHGMPAADAPAFLRAAGGRPSDALRLAVAGVSPRSWALLPRGLARGDVAALADQAPAQAIDVLQKLCHDLMAASYGAAPRFFEPQDLPAAPGPAALARWAKSLSIAAKTADHPFNAGLMIEALVSEARSTLNSPADRP